MEPSGAEANRSSSLPSACSLGCGQRRHLWAKAGQMQKAPYYSTSAPSKGEPDNGFHLLLCGHAQTQKPPGTSRIQGPPPKGTKEKQKPADGDRMEEFPTRTTRNRWAGAGELVGGVESDARTRVQDSPRAWQEGGAEPQHPIRFLGVNSLLKSE